MKNRFLLLLLALLMAIVSSCVPQHATIKCEAYRKDVRKHMRNGDKPQNNWTRVVTFNNVK